MHVLCKSPVSIPGSLAFLWLLCYCADCADENGEGGGNDGVKENDEAAQKGFRVKAAVLRSVA